MSGTRRARRRAAAWVAALALAGAAASCGSSGAERPTVEARAVESGGRQTVRIGLHSFYYEPNRVVVKAGVPVELTLKNSSLIVPHNLTLVAPEAGIEINRNLGPRGGAVIEFTPTKAGEYPFYCGKGSHTEKGMTGLLIVIDE